MNRFHNYLESKNLATDFLVIAENQLRKGKQKEACESLIRAVRNMMVANNNVASLYFERRKRR